MGILFLFFAYSLLYFSYFPFSYLLYKYIQTWRISDTTILFFTYVLSIFPIFYFISFTFSVSFHFFFILYHLFYLFIFFIFFYSSLNPHIFHHIDPFFSFLNLSFFRFCIKICFLFFDFNSYMLLLKFLLTLFHILLPPYILVYILSFPIIFLLYFCFFLLFLFLSLLL